MGLDLLETEHGTAQAFLATNLYIFSKNNLVNVKALRATQRQAPCASYAFMCMCSKSQLFLIGNRKLVTDAVPKRFPMRFPMWFPIVNY